MRRSILIGFLILTTAGSGPAQDANVITTTGPVTTVKGSQPIKPASGTAGRLDQNANFSPYIVPGQLVAPNGIDILNDPFDITYTTRQQPIQTSEWWTGLGLQWSGFVLGRTEGVARSGGFISEPFQIQFVDVLEPISGLPLALHGLRFWNQNVMLLRTDGKVQDNDPFGPSNNFAGRGEIAAEISPEVTVGLANVHPLGTANPSKAPWSNVKVRSYSDWGVQVSYADQGSEMTTTMASGSPFAWCERTAGSAPFTVWAGDLRDSNTLTVWYNQDGVLGLTVTTYAVPYNNAKPNPFASTASYVVFADQGTWTETQASSSASMFSNPEATRVAVLAMPHNIDASNTNSLIAALQDLKQYSCTKIAGTKLHFPPIPGSDTSVPLGGGLPLGYDEANSMIRSKLEVITTPFPINGCSPGGQPLQMVFPHHRKSMNATNRQNILMAGGQPQYTWRGVKGEYQGYQGAWYVQEIQAKGLLPYLPSVALNSQLANPVQPGNSAVEDIYDTMKTWFYVQEPIPPPNKLNSVLRNLGTYMGYGSNSYLPGLPAIYESLVIADLLWQSKDLAAAGMDADLKKPKTVVAREIRDELLQFLKELVGQWASAYNSQFLFYNTQFNSTLAYPDGYLSVQNFNDHHFHYGYFLQAAAMIGRYDLNWLQAYLPFIDQLRRDVATYNRSDTQYPFLREFSPFYGHNWADGTSTGGGNNQESTSEALNFAVGLSSLGQVLNNKEWRDLGMFLYEQEILATEQYWFNQDGNLSQSSGTYFNGNWPDELVHYKGPDGTPWVTSLVTNVKQFGIFRNTYFGGIQGSYTIQATPLSAFTLYLGRNQNWLSATWAQFIKEKGYDDAPAPYQVFEASLQSRLPDSGTVPDGTGIVPALQRINALHDNFPGASNTMGKFWAYTNWALGQVDATVVADIASYGVFKKGGQRTYVAYNPTAADRTVTFTDTVSGTKRSLTVPSYSMATDTGAGKPQIDLLSGFVPEDGRLYLRSGGGLNARPGEWMPPIVTNLPYPADASALASSLTTVPVRPDAKSSTPIDVPDAASIVSWTGKFSGTLAPNDTPATRFALYFNQAMTPGWAQAPDKAPNTITARFLYDFDSDGKADRIEIVQNLPLSPGNAFLYQSKATHYYTDKYFGGPDGAVSVFVGIKDQPGGIAPFPNEVSNGTLTVQIYGGSGPQPVFPVPVSVETDPILNRASWVKPPYAPHVHGPLNTVKVSIAAGKPIRTATQIEVPLILTNTGTIEATSVEISQIALRAVAGSGSVSLSGASLPVPLGRLAVGASSTITLRLNVPTTVKKLSISESGVVQAGGSQYRFSLAQVIFP
jgi:hypothetical protein